MHLSIQVRRAYPSSPFSPCSNIYSIQYDVLYTRISYECPCASDTHAHSYGHVCVFFVRECVFFKCFIFSRLQRRILPRTHARTGETYTVNNTQHNQCIVYSRARTQRFVQASQRQAHCCATMLCCVFRSTFAIPSPPPIFTPHALRCCYASGKNHVRILKFSAGRKSFRFDIFRLALLNNNPTRQNVRTNEYFVQVLRPFRICFSSPGLQGLYLCSFRSFMCADIIPQLTRALCDAKLFA